MEQYKYGVDQLVNVPLVTAGAVDFIGAITPVVGDIKIFTDALISTDLSAESVAFTSGSEQPSSGDIIDGATSAASGTFMFAVVTGGTFGAGTAAGFIFLKSVTGTFQSENLDIRSGTANVMTIGADFTAGLFVVIGDGSVSYALTAAELTCKTGHVHIIDSATKAWEDQAIRFETTGNALAQKVGDSDTITTVLGTPIDTDIVTDIANVDTKVGQITSTGSASNIGANASPNGFTLTTGSEVNDEDSTQALDEIRHELTDDSGTLDGVYKFDIKGNAVPVGLKITGVFNSSNDSWDISANIGTDSTPVWQQIGVLQGVNGSATTAHPFDMLDGQVVTDLVGEVQIRINGTGLTSSSFDVDQIIVSKATQAEFNAYPDGRLWYNSNKTNTNTEPGVDGTAGNPVSTPAALKTLSGSTGLSDFHIINGSSFTLAESTANESYFGDNWTLILNGQTTTGAHFQGADVSGVHVGACEIVDSQIGTFTAIDGDHISQCSIEGTITLPVGDVFMDDCHHGGSPVWDFGAAVANTTVHLHKYGGGIELQNIGGLGTDILHLDGEGTLILNVNCSGGTVHLRGAWKIIDNANGAVTITYDDITVDVMAIVLDTGTDGVIIAAAQGPVTFTGGTNEAGITLIGEGSGAGLISVGGQTGSGITATGGSISGDGIRAEAAVFGNGAGLRLTAKGTNAGLHAIGGATGDGILATGGVTSGDGLALTADGSGVSNADLNAILLDTADMQPKFVGITLFRQLLGLIAGKQTANVTALAEIKTTGAGSGTYDEATDSLEASAGGGTATVGKQNDILKIIQAKKGGRAAD